MLTLDNEYYLVNKYSVAAKISAAFAIISFFMTLSLGLYYQNNFLDVLIRATLAMVVFGLFGYLMGYLLGNTFTRRYEEIHEADIDDKEPVSKTNI
jgi:hypothetical protein